MEMLSGADASLVDDAAIAIQEPPRGAEVDSGSGNHAYRRAQLLAKIRSLAGSPTFHLFHLTSRPRIRYFKIDADSIFYSILE